MAEPAASQRAPWLSPTSAARLLSCPASFGADAEYGSGGSVPVAAIGNQNAGTIAHLAVRRWVEQDHWASAGRGHELAQLYQAAAQEVDVDIGELFEGRLTESRLKHRADELVALLRSYGSGVHLDCEVDLRDDGRRLRGTPDIVLRSPSGVAVIDIKSGADASSEKLPEHIEHQLLFYAHLVHNSSGCRPQDLWVFSLRAGARRVPAAQVNVEELIERLEAARTAWLVGERNARPEPGTCRFCRRRTACQPQWDEVASWERPDAIEGTVLRSSASSNGRSAILLRCEEQDVWLTQLPTEVLQPALLTPGGRLRVVRVLAPRRAIEGRTPEWRATELTEISAAP